VLGSFDIGHRIMCMVKFFAKKMKVEMLQFWSFFIFEPSQMTGVFHRTEGFDIFPVATFPNSLTILPEHPYIKSDIVPNDAVRFFSVSDAVDSRKLNNLISRGESSRFCIDKEQSDSLWFFDRRFFLGYNFFRFCFCNHGISMI